MSLPKLIEIVPLTTPIQAEIVVPGSKSITNRALILAALAHGETTLRGALWSEDTQVMVECLQKIGFAARVSLDPEESCNRTIAVTGLGGRMPRSGTIVQPLDLFVGNAGTAARFLAALVCLGDGVYRLHGTPRMHDRPQASLLQALRQLGYRIDSPNDRLPAVIHGTGPRQAECRVGVEESSQFASALLLCARKGHWQIEVVGEKNGTEMPYVEMTERLIGAFPENGGSFQIEPDSSSASYFWAAAWLLNRGTKDRASSLTVRNWPSSAWQIDSQFPAYLKSSMPNTLSRRNELGDSIMTAIVLAPFDSHPIQFTGLGRLRLQECDRVSALAAELDRCGAEISESREGLEVFPSELRGAEIETYNDHRMAMCFAILGLKVSGIKIKNPDCVKKTFPNFFQKLTEPPPVGLGATILDGVSGQPLNVSDLFAE